MTTQDRTDFVANPCPKGVWVMQVLSDDEALDSDQTLPRGLAFHLARCDSCRALADGLRAVSRGVALLAESEPATDLYDRADSRALDALRAGGALTGRTDVADLPLPERIAGRVPLPYRLMPYAAAACVAFAAAAWWWAATDTERPGDGVPLAHAPVHADQYAERPESSTVEQERAPAASPSGVDDGGPLDPSAPDATADAPKQRLARVTRYRLPIPRDHLEAALGTELHNVQPAFVLPGLRGRRLIDRPMISYQTTAVLPEPQP